MPTPVERPASVGQPIRTRQPGRTVERASRDPALVQHDPYSRSTSPSYQPSRLDDHLLPAILFVLALAVAVYGIGWGLPNGNDTWANDAIRPGAPLSILHRLFVAHPLNSGWFWFKYPFGHVFVLATAYAPYLAWLFASGGISTPTSDYPYGMANPETTLATLAVIGRLVSALMAAGSVVLVYFAIRRSFGRLAAVAGAVATGLCYPIVYYAHTTNVEVPYVFWMLVAFLAAVRLVEGDPKRRWWLWLGAGAAMSVSTKELGAGFFLALPPVIVVAHLAAKRPLRDLVRGGLIAAMVAVVVVVLANDVVLNPQGFLNRVGFLTQTLPEQVALKYAPYYFPIDLGAGRSFQAELAQLALTGNRLVASLGWVTAFLAISGVVIAAVRRPWWTALAACAAAAFYLLGARAMLSLSMRYVLPLAVVGTMFAGIALGRLLDPEGGGLPWVRRAVAALALAWIVVYGLDVNRMLAHDPRYDAERWLAGNLTDGDVVEIWQQSTYLPRMPSAARVDRVDFDDRSIEAFRQRNPDYVVLSTAGIAGVTLAYKQDWKDDDSESDEWVPSQKSADGTVMNYKRKSNIDLLEGIRSGALGYREVADFSFRPLIRRPLLQSLNPTISIYRRETGRGLGRGESRRDGQIG
jgi:4-amino-4-deoxy-L-arabinose transferase-like glycosyltransferase